MKVKEEPSLECRLPIFRLPKDHGYQYHRYRDADIGRASILACPALVREDGLRKMLQDHKHFAEFQTINDSPIHQ